MSRSTGPRRETRARTSRPSHGPFTISPARIEPRRIPARVPSRVRAAARRLVPRLRPTANHRPRRSRARTLRDRTTEWTRGPSFHSAAAPEDALAAVTHPPLRRDTEPRSGREARASTPRRRRPTRRGPMRAGQSARGPRDGREARAPSRGEGLLRTTTISEADLRRAASYEFAVHAVGDEGRRVSDGRLRATKSTSNGQRRAPTLIPDRLRGALGCLQRADSTPPSQSACHCTVSITIA